MGLLSSWTIKKKLFQCLKRLQQENEYIVFISINDYITEISETETPKNTTEYIIDDEKLPYNHPFKWKEHDDLSCCPHWL